MFTRQHYIAVAAQIKDAVEYTEALQDRDVKASIKRGVKIAAINLCSMFKGDNYKFDREKFMTACGLKENDDTQV